MKTPIFPHSKTLYTLSWILTIPILIDICTGCNLFSFWLAWLLFIMVAIISIVRLIYSFKQKLYKFSFGLIAQLLLGAAILLFFQLSFNHIIDTPVSDPITPTVVEITPPKGLGIDTVTPKDHSSKEIKEKSISPHSERTAKKK